MDLMFKLLKKQKNMIIRKPVSWLNSTDLTINAYVFKLRHFMSKNSLWLGRSFLPFAFSTHHDTVKLRHETFWTLSMRVLCLYNVISSCHSLRSFCTKFEVIVWHLFLNSIRQSSCWFAEVWLVDYLML